MGLDPELQLFYEQEENSLSSNGTIESLVYTTLIGRGESQITGSMKNWSVLDRIKPNLEKVPVLLLSGFFDSIPYQEYELFKDQATVKIISEAGHAPFYETPNEFWVTIDDFLRSLY